MVVKVDLYSGLGGLTRPRFKIPAQATAPSSPWNFSTTFSTAALTCSCNQMFRERNRMDYVGRTYGVGNVDLTGVENPLRVFSSECFPNEAIKRLRYPCNSDNKCDGNSRTQKICCSPRSLKVHQYKVTQYKSFVRKSTYSDISSRLYKVSNDSFTEAACAMRWHLMLFHAHGSKQKLD